MPGTTPRSSGRCPSPSGCCRSSTPPSGWRWRRSPPGGSSPGASIIGLFLVTSIVAGVLVGPYEESGVYLGEPNAAALLDLLTLPLVLRDLVFLGHIEDTHPMSGLANGGLYAVGVFAVVVVAALATLLVRYDEVER